MSEGAALALWVATFTALVVIFDMAWEALSRRRR